MKYFLLSESFYSAFQQKYFEKEVKIPWYRKQKCDWAPSCKQGFVFSELVADAVQYVLLSILYLFIIVPRQDVHVFAEEKDSDGKRGYVVATLEEFWSKYRLDASQYWEQLQTLRIMVKREREIWCCWMIFVHGWA